MPIPTLALLLVLLAAPPEPDYVRVAGEFLRAYRAKSPGGQALAVTRRVPYARVVQHLLMLGEADAARALAEQRGKADRDGLLRLCQAFRRPTQQQVEGLVQAEAFIRRGVPDDALVSLGRAGEPVEGTVFGTMVVWTRARALLAAGQVEAGIAEMARAAKLALACGWLEQARDAENVVAHGAPLLPDRVAAAGRFLDACKRLDDADGRLAGLQTRAKLLERGAAAATRAGKKKEAADLRRAFRADVLDAAELARRLGRRVTEADLRIALAAHWQNVERQPKQALRFYREAEPLLEELGANSKLAKVRLNIAIALTHNGQYDEALALLDSLRTAEGPDRRVLEQRAYVLARSGRIETATKAYADVLAAIGDDPARPRLLVDAGEIELQRGDLHAAARLFDEALARDRDYAQAYVGRARVRGQRGDEADARADFAAALKRIKDRNERVRVVLLQAAQLRSWGRIAEAFELVRAEIASFSEENVEDYLNASVAFLVAADLALLVDDTERALKLIAHGGTLFVRLNQPQYAVESYAREVLLQVSRKDKKEAIMRLQLLVKMAGASDSPRLKATAKTTEAVFEARAGRTDKALTLLDEAAALAAKAGDGQRRATALVHKALLAPDDAVKLVDEALAALDAVRVRGAEHHPLVEGERADHAPGIGLQMLLRQEKPAPETALRWIERAKADRLQIALRGREPLLEAVLPVELHEAYVAARGALLEARQVDRGVAQAEAAFDAVVASIRSARPDVAAIAFPAPPTIDDVRKHLREDEVLVLMLDDPYQKAIVAITRQDAVAAVYDPERPLDAVAPLLKGKPHVIVAPDGLWAARPLAFAPFGKGEAGDTFRFFHVASAASFVQQRTAPAPARKAGLAVVGNAPVPARAVDGPPALLHLGVPGVLALDFTAASHVDRNAAQILWGRRAGATVVLAETKPRARSTAQAEGVTGLVEALRLGGARAVIVSLTGKPPAKLLERFYANCLDKGLSPATSLQEARQWLRKQKPQPAPGEWGGLVYYGLP
jgi:tetratricopeptide (TPR) repeat protein